MAFNGIIPAPPLKGAPCGLFSVARVVDHPTDEHWIAGAEVETNAFPVVSLRNNQDESIGNEGVIHDGTNDPKSYVSTPFFVELKARTTNIDYVRQGDEFVDTMKDQIKAVTQKAVERELWEGPATQAATTPEAQAALYLRAAGGATVVSSGGASPEKALSLIEQAISNSPTGGRGTIHMTRDVASALGSRLRYFEKNEIDEKTYAVTRLGTKVVIGSGYTGAGPVGATGAAASATNKWIYVTGDVVVDLGKTQLVSWDTPSINDHEALLSVAAAVRFDPSLFATAQVTLP